jgi:hypothetical protein
MPDGDLKVKAFEVILEHMMQQEPESKAKPAHHGKTSAASEKTKEQANSKSSVGRILLLREEGFFKDQSQSQKFATNWPAMDGITR